MMVSPPVLDLVAARRACRRVRLGYQPARRHRYRTPSFEPGSEQRAADISSLQPPRTPSRCRPGRRHRSSTSPPSVPRPPTRPSASRALRYQGCLRVSARAWRPNQRLPFLKSPSSLRQLGVARGSSVDSQCSSGDWAFSLSPLGFVLHLVRRCSLSLWLTRDSHLSV